MKRIPVIILIVTLAGAAGYLGYLNHTLSGEKRGLEEAVVQTERKAAQMKQRSEEEKTRNAAAQRAKAAAETKKAEAEASLKAVRAEADASKTARDELAQQLESVKKSQSAGQGELARRIAALESERADLTAKLQKSGEAVRLKESELERLTRENQALRADLEKSTRESAKMREHNKKLVAIAEDLVLKFQQKGNVQGLLQNEPFTQIGKIEYEKMRQEYLDAIDKEKIRK